MSDKIQITHEQATRIGTIHRSRYKKCPDCGAFLTIMPEDFIGDSCLEWCSKCNWKNYEVIDA